MVLLVLVGLAFSAWQRRSRDTDPGGTLPEECRGLTSQECRALLASGTGGIPGGGAEITLEAS